jgi:iron complex outermembrane receptor protein
MKELLLRASLEGGFRAPNLAESAASRKTSFSNGVSDPKRCSAATAYANDLQAMADALPDSDGNKAVLSAQADSVRSAECAEGVPQTTTNNPALKPEVSRSYSLGLLFEPMRDLSLSLDYWNIHRKDEIGLKDTQEVLAQEGDLPPGITVSRGSLGSDPTFVAPPMRCTRTTRPSAAPPCRASTASLRARSPGWPTSSRMSPRPRPMASTSACRRACPWASASSTWNCWSPTSTATTPTAL